MWVYTAASWGQAVYSNYKRYPINRWSDTSLSQQSARQKVTTWLHKVQFCFSPFLWSKGSSFNQTNWLLPDLFPMTTVQKGLRQSRIRTLNSKNSSALDCSLPNWLCNSVIVQCHQIDWISKHALASLIPWKKCQKGPPVQLQGFTRPISRGNKMVLIT